MEAHWCFFSSAPRVTKAGTESPGPRPLFSANRGTEPYPATQCANIRAGTVTPGPRAPGRCAFCGPRPVPQEAPPLPPCPPDLASWLLPQPLLPEHLPPLSAPSAGRASPPACPRHAVSCGRALMGQDGLITASGFLRNDGPPWDARGLCSRPRWHRLASAAPLPPGPDTPPTAQSSTRSSRPAPFGSADTKTSFPATPGAPCPGEHVGQPVSTCPPLVLTTGLWLLTSIWPDPGPAHSPLSDRMIHGWPRRDRRRQGSPE